MKLAEKIHCKKTTERERYGHQEIKTASTTAEANYKILLSSTGNT